jgi:hypothetical protein
METDNSSTQHSRQPANAQAEHLKLPAVADSKAARIPDACAHETRESPSPQTEATLLVSLHDGHRNKTPSDLFGRVEASSPWRPVSITPLELIDHISAGNAWVGCHLSGGRSEANAGGSNLIALDIDGDLSLEDFWAKALVQRCCIFTATSCSHTAESNRFRAVFRCDEHDNPSLHKAIYHHWLAALNLQLKDDSGEKPERLWFGNDAAEIQFGAGEPISWDIVEAAKEALAADLAIRSLPWPETSASDAAKDNERAAYCLQHLLRPSDKGEYDSYWKDVFNAAAATNSDLVWSAFVEWHIGGYHFKQKNEKRIERDRHGAGTKTPPGPAAGVIISFAKSQNGGDGWWKLLPEHLWFGGGGSTGAKPPTVLMRARSAADIAPAGGTISFSQKPVATVPDVVPTAAALEQLAKKAPVPLMQAKWGEQAEPAELSLTDKIRRLYMLRAFGVLQTGDDLQMAPKSTRAFLDRELLGEVVGHPGYCNQPSEVERDLLKMFRSEHGLEDDSNDEVQGCRLTGANQPRPRWLIPGFLLVGGEHILYAKAGIGKTTLGLHMARAVTGDPAMDRFLDSGPINNHHLWKQSQVVFIGTDMYSSAKEMTNAALADFGLAGLEYLEQIDWWFQQKKPRRPGWMLCLKDLIKLYNTLESAKATGNPVVAVFIDSMKAVCPDHLLVGQQGFKDYIKLVREICGEFDAALIWIHHSAADGSRAQGISRITEGSDANLHLKRDDKTKRLTLEVEKIRGGGIKGRARTLCINPFRHTPQLLPNPDEVPSNDNHEDDKKQMVIEVLAAHFNKHRLLNMTSSAKYIESTYTGIKIGEVEKGLKASFPGSSTSFSRSTLQRLLRDLVTEQALTTSKNGIYRLPPHFQLNFSEQSELAAEDEDSDTEKLPGWRA